jgi:hypothetical protein
VIPSVGREKNFISFERLEKMPRYYMRRFGLWSWFNLTDELREEYNKLTTQECMQMDAKAAKSNLGISSVQVKQ